MSVLCSITPVTTTGTSSYVLSKSAIVVQYPSTACDKSARCNILGKSCSRDTIILQYYSTSTGDSLHLYKHYLYKCDHVRLILSAHVSL